MTSATQNKTDGERMFHKIKMALLKKKLESTRINTSNKKEELEIQREITEAAKIKYTPEEIAEKQAKLKAHNERAELLQSKAKNVFGAVSSVVGNAVGNMYEEEPKKKGKKK